MSLMEWCAGLLSALASLLFFWLSTTDNYAHPIFRLTSWVSKVAFYFSPYLQITVSEYGDERFQRSEFFLAVEAYLSQACSHNARKLKADIGRNCKNLQVNVDDDEEVVDTYRGATIWWHASKKQPPRNTVISFHPGQEEKRFYQVVFHRRHRDLVIYDYLPDVLNEGRAATIQNRPRRLFTNKPSSRWRSDGANGTWNHVAFQHPATFDTLAMDPDEKGAIIDDLLAFREAKDYYTKVGKAWKRGYLLYGPPGTGKSTMIAAMANFLEYDVYDLELTAVKNNTELRKLFIETKSKSIIVIEDIDCSIDLTGKRKDKKSNNNCSPPIDPGEDEDNKVTLSGVLNFIDGLWSACGGERIIIFTTNNKDKLDPALIRRGRMDKHIVMSYCRFEAFKVLARNFLDVEEHELFGEIRQLLEETDVTPADVAENLMFMSVRKKRDANACLDGLVEALKKAKEKAAAKALADAKAKVMEAAKPKEETREKEDGKDETSDSEGAKMDQAQTGHDVMTTGSPSLMEADSNEWVLDTSSLIHHTFNQQLLHDQTTDDLQDVGHERPVLEHGSVHTQWFKVPDVHYIQGATRNVISVAQLALRHGLVTVFEPTCGYVRNRATGQDVGRAHLSNGGIYVLDYLLIQQDEGGGIDERERKTGGVGQGGDGDKNKKGGGRVGGGGGGASREGGGGGAAGGGGGCDEGGEGDGDANDGGGEEDEDEGVEELEQSSQAQMFGLPRSERTQDLTVGVFSTSTNGLGRREAFYVDSGAENHVTWNGDVLFPYPQHLSINTAINSIIGVSGSCLSVRGIGYVDSAGGSLDRVLFVPDSIGNLVSVSQLTRDYSVNVRFYMENVWIERMLTGERIGHGNLIGGLYLLDRFEAECLVQQNPA